MKLTANGEQIILFEDSTLSIERNSPLFNDQTGAFSYPISVPRRENNKALGLPGRLTRVGDIPEKTFVLEDRGVKLMTGTVEFDAVPDAEVGMILESGMTEFYAKMKDVSLGKVDFGTINLNQNWQNIVDSLNEYSEAERANYIATPFRITTTEGVFIVNSIGGDGDLQGTGIAVGEHYYCLQFRFSFLLTKIFESAGYSIVLNEFETSELNNAIMFGKIFGMHVWGVYGGTKLFHNWIDTDTMVLADLMPDDENVVDFISKVKTLFCLAIDINERTKEVSIYFKKKIFEVQNVDSKFQQRELAGGENYEQVTSEGMKLTYSAQTDDDLACEFEFSIYETVETYSSLPTPTAANKALIYKVAATNRTYIVENTGTDSEPTWKWKRYARLKPFTEGTAETEFELQVYVPRQTTEEMEFCNNTELDLPFVSATLNESKFLTNIPFAISMYHGRKNVGGYNMPITTFDEYFMQGTYSFATNLLPATLYNLVYAEWMQWKTYRARKCVKYLEVSLWELVMMQWYKRYLVNSVALVISTINYEVPFTGTVKIEAFTS